MVSIIRCNAGMHPEVDVSCRSHLMTVMPDNANLVEINQSPDIAKLDSQNDLYNHTAVYFTNVFCALNQCPPGPVFICEYDCLYPEEYFDEGSVRKGHMNVTLQMIYLSKKGFFPRKRFTTSSVVCDRNIMREIIWKLFDKMTHEHVSIARHHDYPIHRRLLEVPVIDVRHDKNVTGSRCGDGEYYQVCPHWGEAGPLYRKIVGE